MSEQVYRRFMERHRRRMANRRPPQQALLAEPVLGRSEEHLGVLGLPLPKPDHDLADIVLDLLASADAPPLENEAQTVARAGRGGETAVGHLTPGEIAIPERLQTPEIMAALQRASLATGAPLPRMQVGHPANRVNPKTGAPEFDDDDQGVTWIDEPPQGHVDELADRAMGAGGPDAAPLRVDPTTDENVTVLAAPLPVTPADRSLMRAVQLGEAAGQGREAMDAVGWTLINRQARSGASIPDEVYKKTNKGLYEYNAVGQPLFSGALDGTLTGNNGRDLGAADSSAQGILDGSTKDPTGGATHFYRGSPDKPLPGFFADAVAAGRLVPTGQIGPFTFLKEPKR